GVVRQLVAEVHACAADRTVFGLAGRGVARAAEAGADLGGQVGTVVVDEAVAVADRERGLVVVGRELVVLVAAAADDVAAVIELVGAGRAEFVAVGVELVAFLVGAVAVEVSRHLALGPQRGGVPLVLPLRGFLAEGEPGVEVLRAGVATAHGEAEFAGAGPAVGRCRVLGVGRQRGQQDQSGKQSVSQHGMSSPWLWLRKKGRASGRDVIVSGLQNE